MKYLYCPIKQALYECTERNVIRQFKETNGIIRKTELVGFDLKELTGMIDITNKLKWYDNPIGWIDDNASEFDIDWKGILALVVVELLIRQLSVKISGNNITAMRQWQTTTKEHNLKIVINTLNRVWVIKHFEFEKDNVKVMAHSQAFFRYFSLEELDFYIRKNKANIIFNDATIVLNTLSDMLEFMLSEKLIKYLIEKAK